MSFDPALTRLIISLLKLGHGAVQHYTYILPARLPRDLVNASKKYFWKLLKSRHSNFEGI